LKRKINAYATILMILIFLFFFSASVQGQLYSNPHTYRVRYTVTIVNIDSRMDRLEVYLPIPSEWPSQRNVTIERIEPTPYSINEDPAYGNRMAHFPLHNVPKHSSHNFTIQYTFTFYETHFQVDPAKVGDYNRSAPEYIRYTTQRPARDVESDDPVIQAAAGEIVGGETNPCLKAKRIYNWIVANIEYEYPSPWGAKETYLKRRGDCGMYTALFCAMCI